MTNFCLLSAENCVEGMKTSSADCSDDPQLTNDDLLALSDLFGCPIPTPIASRRSQSATSIPRCCRRKRLYSTNVKSRSGGAVPKSTQQRQKLEIENLKTKSSN
uniref:Uncharacterized protein n=1 Tax=Hyaloperonospora arabidopsidis (strain Emoy2) TaxID=559515 RepID=M4BVE3_HYAAE